MSELKLLLVLVTIVVFLDNILACFQNGVPLNMYNPLDPKSLQKLYTSLENMCRDRGFIAGKSGRHMKFPYTYSAKIAQFPLFHYMRHNNIWMYYPFGLMITFYAMSKIHFAVNSESYVRNWEETQRKIAEKEHADH